MNGALNEKLVDVAQKARAAGHGNKGALYRAACTDLGISPATLQRKLGEVAFRDSRKQRADAGDSALTLEEAKLISGVLMESIRKNDKQLSSVKTALTRLRANGLIKAAFVDNETGELRFLSESTVHRALRNYGVHPEQLLAPAPAVKLVSKHPNHVWSVDASISTLFYLGEELQPMPGSVYYKNKPGNFDKIKRLRLWRYVVTDHTTGTIYIEYVLGAESAENLCNVLIHAMQKRGGSDPFHGVPFIILTDPGAAMSSATFRNLCKALQITLIINKVGNARGKGQVEQAHNIVECDFESGLNLQAKPTSLEQINALAWKWMRLFNATAIHSRTGCSRYSKFLTIKEHQLRLAPDEAFCRELAISAPESRKVTTFLQVPFNGKTFDVSTVPGVMVGEKLMLTRNPWRDADSAQVVILNDEGREIYHVVEAIKYDDSGFAVNGNVIGEEYKNHKDTVAQTARKEIEKLATNTTSLGDAERARKGRHIPFGGAIDPYKHIDDTPLPTYLPKRGTTMDIARPQLESQKLAINAALLRLRNVMGEQFDTAMRPWLLAKFGDGIPEDQIDQIARDWQARNITPANAEHGGLRLVGGK